MPPNLVVAICAAGHFYSEYKVWPPSEDDAVLGHCNEWVQRQTLAGMQTAACSMPIRRATPEDEVRWRLGGNPLGDFDE